MLLASLQAHQQALPAAHLAGQVPQGPAAIRSLPREYRFVQQRHGLPHGTRNLTAGAADLWPRLLSLSYLLVFPASSWSHLLSCTYVPVHDTTLLSKRQSPKASRGVFLLDF